MSPVYLGEGAPPVKFFDEAEPGHVTCAFFPFYSPFLL